jgi:hypothetical protein
MDAFQQFSFSSIPGTGCKTCNHINNQPHITRFMPEDSVQPVKNDQVHQAQVIQTAMGIRPYNKKVPGNGCCWGLFRFTEH